MEGRAAGFEHAGAGRGVAAGGGRVSWLQGGPGAHEGRRRGEEGGRGRISVPGKGVPPTPHLSKPLLGTFRNKRDTQRRPLPRGVVRPGLWMRTPEKCWLQLGPPPIVPAGGRRHPGEEEPAPHGRSPRAPEGRQDRGPAASRGPASPLPAPPRRLDEGEEGPLPRGLGHSFPRTGG